MSEGNGNPWHRLPDEPRAPCAERAAVSDVLASAGALDVMLTNNRGTIRQAQKLRYQVFFEGGSAIAAPAAKLTGRDLCRFDGVCDHLVVVDKARPNTDGSSSVVGAYRLLRQDVAAANFGFYSAREFDVGALIARHPGKRFLELGRSCVANGYRGKRTLELLWRGIWAYALRNGVDVMFGCASFPGADPNAHAAVMRLLSGDRKAVADWNVSAIRAGFVTPSATEVTPRERDARLRGLPALVKGYWRLGAHFSHEAVVDASFGTTDVLVVLPIEDIAARYRAFFAPGEDLAAIAA